MTAGKGQAQPDDGAIDLRARVQEGRVRGKLSGYPGAPPWKTIAITFARTSGMSEPIMPKSEAAGETR